MPCVFTKRWCCVNSYNGTNRANFASFSYSYICPLMKKRVPVSLLAIVLSFSAFSQMHVKKPNFTSFRTDKKETAEILIKESSPAAQKHPEFGITPYNAQCTECVELIDQRTLDSRQFIDIYDKGHTYSQQSYFPLHYRKFEGDVWHTIDQRLRPTADKNVYAAKDQPVVTKCDLNKQSSSLNVRGFEFEFNKNLSLYYFDDNTLYSKTEQGNYSTYNIGEEGLNVKNLWTGIDMEQIFSAGQIKTNFVINAPLQIPITKGWMVIEDHFTLPEGYSFEESSNGSHLYEKYYRGDYLLKDPKGELVLTYEKPVYLDAKAFGMHGIYKLLRTGNDYTLQTLVPVEWLNKKDNTYPLFIDPTVYGATKMGDFTSSGLPSASMGFTTTSLGACPYKMNVTVPGKSKLTNAYVDVEYTLTYDNTCGTPPLPPPFCTFNMVTMEVLCDTCGTSTGLLSCNPAQPPFTGTCTTDSNLVPGANAIRVNNFVPNYLNCMPAQCPDYHLWFTLLNRDATCGDVCGYLCARGNMWRMTIEACQVDGFITQDKTQVCAGQPVTFTGHPNCGVPPYHYAWTENGGNTFDTIYGTPNFVIHPQADVTVGCYVIDNCGISWRTNDLDVTVVATPPADAGSDIYLCAGGAANLGGNPTSSVGASITWTAENITVRNYLNSTTSPNPTAIVPAGVIDTFWYAVSASNGSCARTDTVYVFSNPLPTADAGPDITICSGGTVTLGGSPSSNAAGVQWAGQNATATGWLNNPTAANPQAVIPAGTVSNFYYVLTGTTASCVARDTVNIISNAAPVANAGSDQSLCEGGTATLGGNPTAVGGTSITWSGQNVLAESWLSSTTDPNPQVNMPAGTTGTFSYVVTVNDPLCPRTDTVKVISHTNPVAQIDSNGSTRICTNQSVTISVIGNYTSYLWSNGSNASSISVNQAGNYSATVTDAFDCTAASNVITVSTITVPTLTVFPDTVITYGDSVEMYTDLNLASASIDSFTWYPAANLSCINCTNPVATPQLPAQYYGVNVYTGGCVATDSALIRVVFPNNFFIPNAFTPNGDGNNDNFYIQAQGGVKVILFQVFNRWGEKVHEGSYPWDGSYKGKPAPAGVYIYIFKLGLFGDDYALFRKGSVTMIR